MYEIIEFEMLGRPQKLIKKGDDTFIPFDPANADYQEYLRWAETGNTPETVE